ncbi:MAG: zinc-dependent metalloprotease [Bacteroidetes bacterium]|nr:zinc-dependent metalloprotease [Bacteroidota bacterium]
MNNTKLTTLHVLTAMLFAVSGIAQNKIICGHDLYMNQLESKYPGFKESVSKTFVDTQTKGATNKTATNSNYVVNVVVHVVWKNAIENLDDSIIQSQIDVLNEDFNRLNADSANLRSLFQPIAGNAHITFNLHQIKRVQTTALFDPSAGGIPFDMKYDSLGGSSAVDPTHFLNLWICKIQPLTFLGFPVGQILGFAFPPANLANWPANSEAPAIGEDGVVIDYRCIGRNNPNTISVTGSTNLTIKGRTPVHEIGHYLGLRHIWGDGSNFGGNNCQGNDGIADTPNANDQSQFDCNTTKNTCVDAALPWTTLDAPDMVENFMDYSAETCMNTFTNGQAAHMQNILNGPRVGLLQPVGIMNDINLASTVLVFPNPAQDFIQLQSSAKKITTIELLDITGRSIIAMPSVFDYAVTINTTQVAKGVYSIKLLLENNNSISKKVIIE